ncbi:DUF983 domain-containing protein [Actinoalloteichus sp. AHMU CJ021]|uniref:DUF983 family protein n=1 Tax=Actinoalloteichus caeruleus DSM 43889 TaxID=1120930 RepID=A0ABT1JK36_ACTCY|nr:hypothetical protein [Actinoalloteichus caeruleus]AUS78731.1 DUF983 domain-containing protein [Actinoalloteichus sp. AHMU CJ021]MCP2332886.1 hypothetical protein [Actinoalloteichus caeruleus DSM 43889]
MEREVRGADGRKWKVSGQMEWRHPLQLDEFEHDVSGGNTPGVVISSFLVLFVVMLFLWRPEAVVTPAWLLLGLVLVLVFFPARWLLRRPWTLMAETDGDDEEHPPERWVGVVRGVVQVRQDAATTARNIEVYSQPSGDGPLQPVD